MNLEKMFKVSLNNPSHILLISFFFVCIYCDDFIHPIKDDEYDILLKLCKGEFYTPVSERTRLQKSTIVKDEKSTFFGKCGYILRQISIYSNKPLTFIKLKPLQV